MRSWCALIWARARYKNPLTPPKESVYSKVYISGEGAMAFTMKDLRYRARLLLHAIRRGERQTLTYRGHAVAQIIPITPKESRAFEAIGFGIWKDRPDMKDVTQWLDEKRKLRFEG